MKDKEEYSKGPYWRECGFCGWTGGHRELNGQVKVPYSCPKCGSTAVHDGDGNDQAMWEEP